MLVMERWWSGEFKLRVIVFVIVFVIVMLLLIIIDVVTFCEGL